MMFTNPVLVYGPSMTRYFKLWFLLLMVCVLPACSSSDKSSQTASEMININFVSTAQTNLDKKGQATPVRVGLYQLKALDNFQDSDFFTLTAGNDPVLNNDIAKTDSFILKPSETRTLSIKPEAGVTALGFVAAYREIDHADWQKIYTINNEDIRPWYKKMFSKKPTTLNVSFEQSAISIKEVN